MFFSSHCYPDSEHMIIEQDENWALFYKEKHALSNISRICVRECMEQDIPAKLGGDTCYIYKGLSDLLKDKKFSLISIDGHWGSERHSRRDIVDFLPDLLEEDWVIVMDDSERPGERDTIKEIQDVLLHTGKTCCIGYYPGMTECCIITTEENKFLCSM